MDHLVAHPLVPFISFTGSVQNGKRVEKTAALAAAEAQGPTVFKSVGLELGGKDAAYVREGECRVFLSSLSVRGERTGQSQQLCWDTSDLLTSYSLLFFLSILDPSSKQTRTRLMLPKTLSTAVRLPTSSSQFLLSFSLSLSLPSSFSPAHFLPLYVCSDVQLGPELLRDRARIRARSGV